MKCLICERPTTWKDNPFRPFCSERCRMIDFGHWVDEDYSVAAEDAPTDAEQVGTRADFSDEGSVGMNGDFKY